MLIRFWGVRGSLATPISQVHLREKLRHLLMGATAEDLASSEAIEDYIDQSPHGFSYGGNTSCIEVQAGDATFVLDAGTGIRGLGASLMQDGRGKTGELHCLFTHFHWDHICGFPFFAPIYVPDRLIRVWSGRSDAEQLLAGQMGKAYFPVKWPTVPADIRCTQLDHQQTHQLGDATVRLLPLIHPDKAFGYRIEHGGRAVCYLTDTEVSKDPNRLEQLYTEFVTGADVVIVDAMYGFLQYHEHVNFGHSTVFNWIDFFRETNIGELVIFHHDPMASDPDISGLCEAGTRYRNLVAPKAQWALSAAREGQSWDLPER
jgi:phosphoribosyl 1,2-cyclic phosphodiesterase